MLRYLTKRNFSKETPLNFIQQIPSYQKALEFAHDTQYDKSINQLEKTISEIESTVGKNTNLHLYIFQRMASIYQIQKDFHSMESIFQRCIETSENSPFNQLKQDTRTSNVFVWQNNLLKFYLENNIDKAIDYGHELKDEIGGHLQSHEK